MKRAIASTGLVLLAGSLCACSHPSEPEAEQLIETFEHTMGTIGPGLTEASFVEAALSQSSLSDGVSPSCARQLCIHAATAGPEKGTIEAVVTAMTEEGGGLSYRQAWIFSCFSADVIYGTGKVVNYTDVSCPDDEVLHIPGGNEAEEIPIAELTSQSP